MADEEIDLYGDLDDYDSAEQLKKTEKQCSDLQERLRECEEQQSIKDKEFQILNKDFRNMNANLNSLFQTAKTEIQRKDNQIRDLRKELDNIRFRRDRRMHNEKNSQLRHIATQTDVPNEPKILQENQMKNESELKKAKERTEQLNENGLHSMRNPFSSSRNEFSHVNGNAHDEDLKDRNTNDLSRERNGRSRHRQTNDTCRRREKHQRTADRINSERTKRHRSRSISKDRKRSRRSKSKRRDHSTNRFAEALSPEKNAHKETHRTGVRRIDYKKRFPESTLKDDSRDKIQRRLHECEERHGERTKHKAKNENMERRERHLLNLDERHINVEEKPTLKSYNQISNGVELEKPKVDDCVRIAPQQGEVKRYENLEDGEIVDENSFEVSPAELKTSEIVEKIEQSDVKETPKESNRFSDERKDPLEIDKAIKNEIDMKYTPERVFMPTKESNSDLKVQIPNVNCMKSVVSENVHNMLKIDLRIKTENVSPYEPKLDKMQKIANICPSSIKSDEISVNIALNTSDPLDTSKVVKNISTSSTDYTLVEDGENNDVIIYVSRKKRKKKKSIGNHQHNNK